MRKWVDEVLEAADELETNEDMDFSQAVEVVKAAALLKMAAAFTEKQNPHGNSYSVLNIEE